MPHDLYTSELYPGSVWRRARISHDCDNRFWGGVRCPHVIQPGERYLDTGESNERAGGFDTDKWCAGCVKWYRKGADHAA